MWYFALFCPCFPSFIWSSPLTSSLDHPLVALFLYICLRSVSTLCFLSCFHHFFPHCSRSSFSPLTPHLPLLLLPIQTRFENCRCLTWTSPSHLFCRPTAHPLFICLSTLCKEAYRLDAFCIKGEEQQQRYTFLVSRLVLVCDVSMYIKHHLYFLGQSTRVDPSWRCSTIFS